MPDVKKLFILNVEPAKDNPFYEVRTDAEPERLTNGHETLKEAAQMAYVRMQSMQADNVTAVIVFTPPHDVECVPGQAPRRLLALTDDERRVFFAEFNITAGWDTK